MSSHQLLPSLAATVDRHNQHVLVVLHYTTDTGKWKNKYVHNITETTPIPHVAAGSGWAWALQNRVASLPAWMEASDSLLPVTLGGTLLLGSEWLGPLCTHWQQGHGAMSMVVGLGRSLNVCQSYKKKSPDLTLIRNIIFSGKNII